MEFMDILYTQRMSKGFIFYKWNTHTVWSRLHHLSNVQPSDAKTFWHGAENGSCISQTANIVTVLYIRLYSA